jgi:hypothetical protein
MKMPASHLAAGLLCFASALFGLVTGTSGLELHELAPGRTLVVVMALVHIYCGMGLWKGDNPGRVITLWLLVLGFFTSWATMAGAIYADGEFSVYAGGVIRILVAAWFIWHLSGHNSLVYSRGGHNDHAHA